MGPPSSGSARLSEVGNALGLLKNDSGVVAGGGAGRLSLVGDPGVGPVGYAGAATAALFVAHDIAPLRAIHVAMGVGKRSVVSVNQTVMPGTNDVRDLVGDSERVGG